MRYFELFAIAVITVGVLRLLKVLLSKYIIARIHHGRFAQTIAQSLSMERLFTVLRVTEQ